MHVLCYIAFCTTSLCFQRTAKHINASQSEIPVRMVYSFGDRGCNSVLGKNQSYQTALALRLAQQDVSLFGSSFLLSVSHF